MDKEDDIFKHQMGQENPFRVPEGYFEDLVSSISTRLLDENQNDISLHPHRRIKLIGVAAACICASRFLRGDRRRSRGYHTAAHDLDAVPHAPPEHVRS